MPAVARATNGATALALGERRAQPSQKVPKDKDSVHDARVLWPLQSVRCERAQVGSSVYPREPIVAICIGSLWCTDRRLPTVIPIKNIAATITAIAPSFRGGVSLRICLSKSS